MDCIENNFDGVSYYLFVKPKIGGIYQKEHKVNKLAYQEANIMCG